jgi:hypothetical protein
MRSIVVPLELTVRPVSEVEGVESTDAGPLLFMDVQSQLTEGL